MTTTASHPVDFYSWRNDVRAEFPDMGQLVALAFDAQELLSMDLPVGKTPSFETARVWANRCENLGILKATEATRLRKYLYAVLSW